MTKQNNTTTKHLKNKHMEQTTIEWLSKKLESFGDSQYCKLEWEKLDLLIKKAKAMEKRQIVDAYRFGFCDEYAIGSKKYYNKTYKK
jgi:hypothetical protein